MICISFNSGEKVVSLVKSGGWVDFADWALTTHQPMLHDLADGEVIADELMKLLPAALQQAYDTMPPKDPGTCSVIKRLMKCLKDGPQDAVVVHAVDDSEFVRD